MIFLFYLIFFIFFFILVVGVGGGNLIEVSVVCMVVWMADDGFVGCCGNVMLFVGGGVIVVGGVVIIGSGFELFNVLK